MPGEGQIREGADGSSFFSRGMNSLVIPRWPTNASRVRGKVQKAKASSCGHIASESPGLRQGQSVDFLSKPVSQTRACQPPVGRPFHATVAHLFFTGKVVDRRQDWQHRY